LIDASRPSQADASTITPDERTLQHVENLRERLSAMKRTDIESFDNVAQKQIQRADTADLHNAAMIALQGGGDDGFLNFSGWLILQGKSVFEEVVTNPDNLADHFSFTSSMESEEFLTVGVETYRKNAGTKLLGLSERSSSVGQHKQYDESKLGKKFPKLLARVNKGQQQPNHAGKTAPRNAAEWDATDKFLILWHFIVAKEKENIEFLRKRRLLACGCCRKIWPLLTDPRSQKAVEVSELYADGFTDKKELESAGRSAALASEDYRESGSSDDSEEEMDDSYYYCLDASWHAAYRDDERPPASHPNSWVSGTALSAGRALGQSNNAMVDVLKDVFGNPFAESRVDTEWLKSNNGKFMPLAKAIYERREFDRLPEFADILEANGFADRRLLSHLRSKGFHVRGCWALDLFLGEVRLGPKSIPPRKKKPT
jgi:hypothetical protein